MSENIGGSDLFGSGGHVWLWGAKGVSAKVVGSVGVAGVARFVLGTGGRPFQVVGKGGPALLKASDSTKAAADAALNTLIDAIQNAVDTGTIYSWEDDASRTGDALMIASFQPAGPRRYGRTGGAWQAWQYYTCGGIDLLGEF